jgi:hypothetical protein
LFRRLFHFPWSACSPGICSWLASGCGRFVLPRRWRKSLEARAISQGAVQGGCPSSRSRRKRVRHLRTVRRSMPSRAATATLFLSSAQASTIRARRARPCAVPRRLTSSLKCAAHLPTAPAVPASGLPYPQQTASASRAKERNPELWHKTTQVVSTELITGSLGPHAVPALIWWRETG